MPYQPDEERRPMTRIELCKGGGIKAITRIQAVLGQVVKSETRWMQDLDHPISKGRCGSGGITVESFVIRIDAVLKI